MFQKNNLSIIHWQSHWSTWPEAARGEPTWVVETTADLHGSQLAVKSHCPRGVGGDLAGILLSSLTATIYKANAQVSTFELRSGREWGLEATSDRWGWCLCAVLEKGSWWETEKTVGGRRGKHAEIERREQKPLKQKGLWQPVPLQMDGLFTS